MKKYLVIFAIFIMFGTMSATALPIMIEKPETRLLDGETGTLIGEIGYQIEGEWNKVGEISGTYELRKRIGIINGEWEIIEGEHAGETGTIDAIFGKIFLFGRITIHETGNKAPIVGFLFIKEDTHEFGGRFMSLIGPALYFKGTYQEN